MKFFILFLIIISFALIILAIVNTSRLKKLEKAKHTPRLSELKGKEFGKYMDYLTKDL